MKTLAIEEAIGKATVGRHGSRRLDDDLLKAVHAEVLNGQASKVQQAVLFAGLLQKELLEKSSLIRYIWPRLSANRSEALSYFEVPSDFFSLFNTLLDFAILPEEEAPKLADFLMNQNYARYRPARALATSILRIRYTEPHEYQALYAAMMRTFPAKWLEPCQHDLVTIAEPFDGLTHSYLVSPALTKQWTNAGWTPVFLCGESSGPKHGVNLKQVALECNETFISIPQELGNQPGYVDVTTLSPALSEWTGLRREMIKRPFLATLEKLPRLGQSKAIVTSAFHGPFAEKTLAIAESAGYEKIAIMRKGREGSLTPSRAKAVEIHISVLVDNKYKRSAHEIPPIPDADDPRISTSIPEECAFIKEALAQGTTNDTIFDSYLRRANECVNLILSEWGKDHTKL